MIASTSRRLASRIVSEWYGMPYALGGERQGGNKKSTTMSPETESRVTGTLPKKASTCSKEQAFPVPAAASVARITAIWLLLYVLGYKRPCYLNSYGTSSLTMMSSESVFGEKTTL